MILTIDELEGKALDWMYERMLSGSYEWIKVVNGEILLYLNDDVNPPGWYSYKSTINDADDIKAAKVMIEHVLGEGPFVVPTDLCSPMFAHKQHEKITAGWGPKDRYKCMFRRNI